MTEKTVKTSKFLHIRENKILLLGLFTILVFLLVNSRTVSANQLSNEIKSIPTFIKVFVIFMSLYHSLMYIMIKEIQRISPSRVWNDVSYGNYAGVALTLSTAFLLHKLYYTSTIASFLLVLAAVFDVLTHFAANLLVYQLIKQIARDKINFFRTEYLGVYVFSAFALYFITGKILGLTLPRSSNFGLVYIYVIFYLGILIYFIYYILIIAKTYFKIGFVSKPFFIGGMGMLPYALSVLIILYAFNLTGPETKFALYYNISLYVIMFVLTISYFSHFIFEYPGLLDSKWKEIMPFDLVKASSSITLAFLASSLYYTVREYPTYAIFQNVSYGPLIIFLLVIIIAIIHILGYTRLISDRTHLKYWNYLRVSLSIHFIATFYVFSLIVLEWSNFTNRTKALSIIFGLLAIVFYNLYALDMRVVISDLNLEFTFNKLDVIRYIVSLYSLFFIIFFGISFTYNRPLGLFSEIVLESYPFILFSVAFFLLIFISYLSVTHKGFEEIMQKNVWSELSYFSSFMAFIIVYILYKSMTKVYRFPLHGMFFVGYFVVLLIETYAISTLGVRSKYEKEEEYAITDLLNFVASHFLRSDYLAEIWEKTLDKYVAPEDRGKTRFDASTRRFDINELNEETKNTVSTAMLFGMYRLSTTDKVAVATNDFSKTLKKDIEDILQEEILLLPEELRADFDEDLYYPVLFEKLVNDLTDRIKTFVPSIEHKILFDKLSRISTIFADSTYDGTKIQIPEETRFSRAEFIEYFKSYLNSLEELFPFEETLLHGPIKSEIKEEILKYGFSVEDLLDLVPTGVEKLDEITEGGLQRKTSTLILCEETRHKKEVLMSFVKQGIKDRDHLIFATSKEPSEIIQGELRKEFPTLKNLTIIDLYQDIHTPDRVINVIEKQNRIVIPTSTVFLRQSIVKTVRRYPKDSHKRVILDVYTDMLKYFHYDELSTIIFQQLDGLRKWNCTTILTLDPSLLTSKQLEEMEKKFENVLVISGRGMEESILIKKLHGGTPQHKIISFH